MAFWKGTLLASPIVRGSSGDTYGTHHSILGVGGYMEVKSITERNRLPVDDVNGIGHDGISSGQRRLGMLVYVHEDNTIYQLKILQSTWNGLTSSGKISALENNNNWDVFVSGDEQIEVGERISKEFIQTVHGFDKGDVIGYDGTEFVTVSSLNAAIVEPLGVINYVIDSDTFKLTFSGHINTSGITDINGSGLTGGNVYYLSDTAGKLTLDQPTGATEISKPMLVTLTNTTGIVLQYRGIYDVITSGGTVSYTNFTGYTATTLTYLDKTVTGATNIAYFTGYTGMQTLPITNLVDSEYNGDYTSVYNHYYRDNNGYIRIGAASDEILRRGYVRSTAPAKSWIWNEYTGDGALIGWILVDGDVTLDTVYGTRITGVNISYSTPAYTATTWTEGSTYSNGSNIVIGTVQGSITDGTVYDNDGPIYKNKEDKELRLRTIVSNTPNNIDITYDDYFIKISGATRVSDVANIGTTGVGVYSEITGSTILLKKLVGGGGTTITDSGNNIVISSSISGESGGSGENIQKTITQFGHGFSVGDVVGYSGSSYSKAIADGTYDGEIIGIISEVIDINNFNIVQTGYISSLENLAINTTYFVSSTTPGEFTDTAPTTYGSLKRPILFADSLSTAWVLPYPGYYITEPITGGTTGGTTAIYYTGDTPSVCTVGGLEAGSTLTGKTYSELLEEILVPELFGTITSPSTSVSLSEAGLYEINCTLSQTVTGNFSRGSIDPQYCSISPYRSGPPDAYCFEGTGMQTGLQACESSTASQTVSGYSVIQGTQTWGVYTRYEEGEPALGSKGTQYCAALAVGCTSFANDSIVGAYPLWATCAVISSIDKISPLYNMSTANDIEINLAAESGNTKQKFEIPCTWLTSRPLSGVQQFNTVSSQWEYPGGDASSSLSLWNDSSATETVQSTSIGYCRYTHACSDRGSVCIKLIF